MSQRDESCFDELGLYRFDPLPRPRASRHGTSRMGATGQAKARWRDFDRQCSHADYTAAVEAARDAMRLEDQAGVALRPIVRELLTGGPLNG